MTSLNFKWHLNVVPVRWYFVVSKTWNWNMVRGPTKKIPIKFRSYSSLSKYISRAQVFWSGFKGCIRNPQSSTEPRHIHNIHTPLFDLRLFWTVRQSSQSSIDEELCHMMGDIVTDAQSLLRHWQDRGSASLHNVVLDVSTCSTMGNIWVCGQHLLSTQINTLSADGSKVDTDLWKVNSSRHASLRNRVETRSSCVSLKWLENILYVVRKRSCRYWILAVVHFKVEV